MQTPTYRVLQIPSGQKMLSIDQIWVCPECGCFGTPVKTDWGCTAHPGVPAELKHITVTDPYEPVSFNKATVRPVVDSRMQHWNCNYAANAPKIGESVHDLPHVDVVYLVGCGPSLEINGHWLRHVDKKNSAIIALNDALNWVLNADYFLCMDHAFKNTNGNASTTAILSPTVQPALVGKKWKDVRWMASSACGHEPFDSIHRDHSSLWLYDEGLNCTFTAYQLIAQMLNPKALVLVGLDCGFTPDRERIGKPLVWSEKEQYVVIPDAYGRPVFCNGVYSRIIAFTLATLAWYSKHGCQVINASVGGALPTNLNIVSNETVAPISELPGVIANVNAKGKETCQTG